MQRLGARNRRSMGVLAVAAGVILFGDAVGLALIGPHALTGGTHVAAGAPGSAAPGAPGSAGGPGGQHGKKGSSHRNGSKGGRGAGDANGGANGPGGNGQGGPGSGPAGPPGPGGPGGSPGPGPILPPVGPDGIKPPVAGVVAVDQLPPANVRKAVSALVVQVAWRDLQPTTGGSLAANNPIDQAIASVRQADIADGMTRGIRIRILAGVDSPNWLKQVDGPPVTMTEPQGGSTGTVPRFWLADFGYHYAQFQQLLAARYDQVPEVREVTVSRCTTFYAEPFQRQITSRADVNALLAAGYSEAADQTCQREAVAAHQVWTATRSNLALNPYQAIASNGSTSQDLGFTTQMMQYCRATLGNKCVLENNSIRYPTVGGSYPQMYQAMASAGRPFAFQTAAPSRVGDINKTLSWAVNQGAGAVEVVAPLIQQAGPSLGNYDAALRTNDIAC